MGKKDEPLFSEKFFDLIGILRSRNSKTNQSLNFGVIANQNKYNDIKSNILKEKFS